MAEAGALAARLHAAWNDRTTIPPFSATGEIETVEAAYATQQAWSALRLAAGERTIGRKIGLTSPAMQQQMGVGEPDFGELWESRRFEAVEGVADVALEQFIQPRVEGEVAFLMGEDLAGPGVTPAEAQGAADAAALAIEIVDSRIEDWRIQLVDTVADNASYGGFVLGPWSEALLASDLAGTEFELDRHGEVLVHERGAAVLGGPLVAVAWLANKLATFGSGIRAGDVVLSGSFGGAIPAEEGATFTLRSAAEPSLTMRFRTGER